MLFSTMRVRDKSKIAFARKLRRELTPPEAAIWARLRVRDTGISFRRQHPIGPYVLDFYCAKAKLAIEVDGLIHDRDEQAIRDEARDALAGRARDRNPPHTGLGDHR
ncbi:MAG: DUF559 domain-containing protein [Asticcacaulis sp.]